MRLATIIGRHIKYNSPRCVAPPGSLEQSSGTPVIIASLMRSGTHLLIDSVLNNCKELRRNPLYIDLDQFINTYPFPAACNDILNAGSYIVKTHYPQLGGESQRHKEIIQLLSKNAKVIAVTRDLNEISSSFQAFSGSEHLPDLNDVHSKFTSFWSDQDALCLNYKDLVNNWDEAMTKFWQYTGLSPELKTRRPPRKNQKTLAYCNKLLTRLLGNRAPIINTTIGFSLKR